MSDVVQLKSNLLKYYLIECRLFIFTSLISASPTTQGHFLFRRYQHLSTPVWLTTFGLLLIFEPLPRKGVTSPFLWHLHACEITIAPISFCLTHPPHPVMFLKILVPFVLSLFSCSVHIQELLRLLSQGAAFCLQKLSTPLTLSDVVQLKSNVLKYYLNLH
jgi:hypothetical protein